MKQVTHDTIDWNERLAALGFSTFFLRQLSLEEAETLAALRGGSVGRVQATQRNGLVLATVDGERTLPVTGRWSALPAEQRPTVGDWVLLDAAHERIARVFERKSLFQRMAAGDKVDVQLIAANVDTVFLVSSCNEEFNLSRLERYLAMTLEAGVQTVLVLTKADLATDAGEFRSRAQALRRDLCVELVDARDPASLTGVQAWCVRGDTIALMGSSGVGKSTLLNTLLGDARQATAEISNAAARGRHTTSHRSLHVLPGGAWLLDSPGMRSLALAGAEHGLAELFDDVAALARACRFADCGHQTEPGCAIRDAVARGLLDERRLANYFKLLREEARSRETLAERRRRARTFARQVRRAARDT
jgi:ribosome biogenesis GTPase / thiamine phosphate phosphatase